jgi:hypothetical protein
MSQEMAVFLCRTWRFNRLHQYVTDYMTIAVCLSGLHHYFPNTPYTCQCLSCDNKIEELASEHCKCLTAPIKYTTLTHR